MLVQCLCSVDVVFESVNVLIICELDAKMQCFDKKESEYLIWIIKY